MMKALLLVAAGTIGTLAALPGQSPGGTSLLDQPKLPKTEAVQYLYPEQVSVAAGKPTPVTLHFRIAPGLHINSHKPREQELIPTELSFPQGSEVKLASADYPAGSDYVLPADPDTKLVVYSGEFAIQVQIVASAGDHLVRARLHYQACDQNACMPPKTITVPIDVIGK